MKEKTSSPYRVLVNLFFFLEYIGDLCIFTLIKTYRIQCIQNTHKHTHLAVDMTSNDIFIDTFPTYILTKNELKC